MIGKYITEDYLNEFIKNALQEDIGEGDHSTLSTISAGQQGKAKLLFKEDGIVAGISLAEKIYDFVDDEIVVKTFKKDGEEVKEGEIGYEIHGEIQTILITERLILNFLQRLSGIATYTHKLVKLIEGTNAKILDTRKTTPGLRFFEKWAVKMGGGNNHRMGLYDMIMLKDNHVDYAGGISKAVSSVKKYLSFKSLDLKIEVETRNLEEVKEALSCGVDMIMLDNMDNDTMKKAVKLVDGKVKTEASGNITEATIRSVAETGVDFISVGALTHSVKSMDMSLKAIFL